MVLSKVTVDWFCYLPSFSTSIVSLFSYFPSPFFSSIYAPLHFLILFFVSIYLFLSPYSVFLTLSIRLNPLHSPHPTSRVIGGRRGRTGMAIITLTIYHIQSYVLLVLWDEHSNAQTQAHRRAHSPLVMENKTLSFTHCLKCTVITNCACYTCHLLFSPLPSQHIYCINDRDDNTLYMYQYISITLRYNTWWSLWRACTHWKCVLCRH